MTSQGPISEADRQLALGDTTQRPVPDRAPDPLVDSAASDGVQPADRGHIDVDPFGGTR